MATIDIDVGYLNKLHEEKTRLQERHWEDQQRINALEMRVESLGEQLREMALWVSERRLPIPNALPVGPSMRNFTVTTEACGASTICTVVPSRRPIGNVKDFYTPPAAAKQLVEEKFGHLFT